MAMRVRPSLLPLSFLVTKGRWEDMRKGERRRRQKQREQRATADGGKASQVRTRQRADGDDVCSKSRWPLAKIAREKRERTRQWWTRSTQEVRVGENAGYVKIGWLRGALKKSEIFFSSFFRCSKWTCQCLISISGESIDIEHAWSTKFLLTRSRSYRPGTLASYGNPEPPTKCSHRRASPTEVQSSIKSITCILYCHPSPAPPLSLSPALVDVSLMTIVSSANSHSCSIRSTDAAASLDSPIWVDRRSRRRRFLNPIDDASCRRG